MESIKDLEKQSIMLGNLIKDLEEKQSEINEIDTTDDFLNNNNMVEKIKQELDDFLLSCGFDKKLFYYPFPVEFLTEYKWKFIGEDYVEVYDNEGYNIKHSFPDIYFEDCDGFYDKHEKYIVFVTSALNHRIKVLTVLDKSLEIKLQVK